MGAGNTKSRRISDPSNSEDVYKRQLSLYPAELRVHDNYLNVYITTGLQRRSLSLYPAELRVPV